MKSGTRRRSLAFGAALAAIVAVSAGCSSSSSPNSASGTTAGSGASGSFTGSPVLIGQEVCQTGYLSATDLYLVNGAQIAVDQLNKAGGILHHQVKLQTVDTQ